MIIKRGLKRALCIVLAAGICVCGGARYSYADTLEEIKQKKEEAQKAKNETQSQLNAVQDDIDDIEGEKEQLEEELEQLDTMLFDLLLEVQIMQADIEDKNNEIVVANAELEDAIAREESQKKAMAARIKYMYEKGNESYLEILIESKSMAEALNKVDFTEKLYEYDRILLERYQLAKLDVAEKKQQLESDLNDLEEMKEDLETQQEELNALIEEKQATVEGFDEQLEAAQEKANAYQKQIKEQSDNLKKINQEEQAKIAEEARKKAEEEARKKAEEAAKKKAAEEAAKKAEEDAKKAQEALAAATTDAEKEAAQKALLEAEEEAKKESSQTSSTTSSSSSSTSSSGTSVKATGSGIGTDIANYGLQFVGNPYVSGGTSLTNGCDCSGFTQSVYKNFGISIPRSSYSQSESGTAIDYANVQPGDILYYGGHVAIYIGNDKIVHASTPSSGIKVSSAFYRSIITIRRYY